jgi:hypothetical protein
VLKVFIKYTRAYGDIINELADAVCSIDNFYSFIEMDSEAWDKLDSRMQHECARTMADDVFYTLGTSLAINVGNGLVKYDGENDIIKVFNADRCVYIVKLT